jgi:hypothetical protein
MLQVMPRLDEEVFTTSRAISEQYGTKVLDEGEPVPAGAGTITTTYRGEQVTAIRGLLPLGSPVRLTTPFFNIYGLLTWSAVLLLGLLFWRKHCSRTRHRQHLTLRALLIGTASSNA